MHATLTEMLDTFCARVGWQQVVAAVIHATHGANVGRMFASIALVSEAAIIRNNMVRPSAENPALAYTHVPWPLCLCTD